MPVGLQGYQRVFVAVHAVQQVLLVLDSSEEFLNEEGVLGIIFHQQDSNRARVFHGYYSCPGPLSDIDLRQRLYEPSSGKRTVSDQ